MNKFNLSLIGIAFISNIFAANPPESGEQHFDKNTVLLLDAYKTCIEQLQQTLGSANEISAAKVEYLHSTEGLPADILYTIGTSNGSFWGPTLTIRRHYEDNNRNYDKKRVLTECNIAY